MKKVLVYSFRTLVVIISIYILFKEFWQGNEGVQAGRALIHEIKTIEEKKAHLQSKINALNQKLAYLNDPEFLQEQQLRKNDLKQKGDLLYLI